MLCGSFSFAWMSSLAHLLNDTCDWRVIALARSGLALVFAAALAWAAGARLVLWRPRILWVRSVAGSVSLVCTFYALGRLPPYIVLTLTNTFPLWVAVLSWPLLGERPSAAVWLAALTGVAGVALIQAQLRQADFPIDYSAVALALVASVSTAVAMLGLHHLQDLDTRAIVVHFSGVAALACAVTLFVGPAAAAPTYLADGRTMGLLLAVGATATVGQLFLTKAFAAGPPAKVSVVGLTQVVFALGLYLLLEKPEFHPATLVGIALVMAPTAWVMALRG
jgi:drug/metabolite transporter (DMT)-like permease